MPVYATAYTIEIQKPSAEDMAILLSKMEYFNRRSRYLLPVFSESPDRICFLLVQRDKHTKKSIKDELFEVFGDHVAYKPFDYDTATESELRSYHTAKKLLANDNCCGESFPRFTAKSRDEVIGEINGLIGFGEFKEACRGLCQYHDNVKKGKKRANYNLVLVMGCTTETDLFVEMLYDLYLSLGVIADPVWITGDVDDAFRTDRNTPFLFYIEQKWGDPGDDHLAMTETDKQMYKLCKRETIYIAVCDKVQYEKLRETDSFNRLFPHSIGINEISREEKAEFIKREILSYGFTFHESVLSSPLVDCSTENIKAQVSLAVRRKLTTTGGGKLTASDFSTVKKKKNRQTAFEELESLIGLAGVKSCIREIVVYLEKKGRLALPCLHMVFKGNPGTGKTTVARIIGRLFGEIGILKHPDLFIEADRNKLVSIYLGGTAAKTASLIKEAQGGVLFIDEAYALNNGEKYDYGNEAIAVLVKQMEDYRKDFVCIMAGYTKEMEDMLDMNPGIRERVQFYIDFPDYTAEELTDIFCALCKHEKYRLSEKAKTALLRSFSSIVTNKDKNFANGRVARKVFDRLRLKQAMRTGGNTITAADVDAVFSDKDMAQLCGSGKLKKVVGFVPRE